ncbi:RNA-directed DNA methylation 4 [Wolffia australiana]
MEGASEPSSSSSVPKTMGKPVIVRVKRKASQMPVDALWVEVDERHPKRAILDLTKLSMSGIAVEEKGSVTTRRVLVQHVETVGSSEASRDLLENCLACSTDAQDFKKKVEERKALFKKDKRQELLHFNARRKHQELARSARFEQIWRSRKTKEEKQDDFLSEMYHLYDIMRVDEEDELESNEMPVKAQIEEDAILCNYMPLIREYLPTAAEEIETKMNSGASNRDTFVYDIYTVESDSDPNSHASAFYPLVQVNEENMFDGESDSDNGTEDSNAENNPRNDYPDEETSDDDDGPRFLDDVDEEYDEEISGGSEDEREDSAGDWRWVYR